MDGIATLGPLQRRATARTHRSTRRGQARSRWLNAAVALLTLGASCGLNMQGAMAQVGSVMQIPVPAPQTSRPSMDSSAAPPQAVPAALPPDTLRGEPLAMPEETVPLGSWAGRAGVKEIALAEMPWMGRAGDGSGEGAGHVGYGSAGYPVAFAAPAQAPVLNSFQSTSPFQSTFQNPFQINAQARYRVLVRTPSETHSEVLRKIIPEAIALANGQTMQAGAFADWQRAQALQRALGAYGFVVEVRGL